MSYRLNIFINEFTGALMPDGEIINEYFGLTTFEYPNNCEISFKFIGFNLHSIKAKSHLFSYFIDAVIQP